MEGELFLRDAETKDLRNKISSQETTIKSLKEQLDGIDTNGRKNSLILKCDEFGKRGREEDIEGKVISILNHRFRDVRVARQDIQTTHRLQGDSTVIVNFLKTKLKEEIYERRMNQVRAPNRGDRLAAPLYVNESLSATNKEIFKALLEAKKRGKIYTVYTRRDLSMMYKKRVAAKGWLSRTMNKAQELLDADQCDQEALRVIQKELETRLSNLDGLQSDLELIIESESEMLDDIEKAGVFRDSVLCVLSKVVKAAIEVPVICAPLSRPSLPASVMAELSHLPMAGRPPPDEPLHVHILVGMDYYWSMTTVADAPMLH
ncbi:hypothetical protein FJT64_000059 [Amphibalanus amphitrite]|uniref:Uncharacterized protein n=1 Tax=Amphibalanus amphitrite TaxID=1232801 RepID=A0A6A4XE90_AMPAM|nr:hypothetical protein FJT64_000059 [Amphibalanus amphitrite]